MKQNVVEIAVTCRVNGVLVANTFSSYIGNNIEEAVDVAIQAASYVKNYENQQQDDLRKQQARELSKSLIQTVE